MPQRRKRPPRKGEVPNYGIDIDDEVEDMNIDDLFGDYVPPQQQKQLVPKPPTYEESLADLLEGKKEIYIDPQYFPQDPQELPPEYDDDEEVDYAIDDEDEMRETLDELGLMNYESVDKVLNQPEMTSNKKYVSFKNNQVCGKREEKIWRFEVRCHKKIQSGDYNGS